MAHVNSTGGKDWNMELTTYRSFEGIQIIRLSGSLVGKEAAQVRYQFRQLICDRSPCLIIDLSHLHYIDARGLSVFVSAYKILRGYHKQGEVLLLNPTPVVLALIELTRLQQSFSIYTEESAAISHY